MMENYQNQSSAAQETYGKPSPLTTDELGNTLILQPTDELGNSTYQQSGQATAIPGYSAGHDHGMLHRNDQLTHTTPGEGIGGGVGVGGGAHEKFPGGHHDQQTQTTATTTAGGDFSGGTHKKKGIMNKIKEKLSGGHLDQRQHY